MRLDNIQYLRALAALAVVLAHSIEYILNDRSFDVIKGGRFGVVLFFVISGFIMVYICGKDKFSFLDFMERRILRIVPLYWVATTGVAIVAILIPWAFRNTVFSFEHYILSILFIPHADKHGDISPMLSLGWTLNYEMFFYLVFAILGRFTAIARMTIITVLFGTLVILGQIFQPTVPILETYTNFYLVPFLAGGWIGLLCVYGKVEQVKMRSGIVLMLTLLATVSASWIVEDNSRGGPLTVVAMTSWSVIAVWLAFATNSWVPRIPWMVHLGDASFSIYLVHMYAVGVAAVVFKHLGIISEAWMLGILIAFVTGTVAGLLSYQLVERPFMRIAKKIHARSRLTPKSA